MLAADFDLDEACLAQGLQMLRHGRSADGELGGNFAGAAAAMGQQLDHAAAVGIGEGEKCVHREMMKNTLN